MHTNSPHRMDRWIRIILALLILVLIGLCALLLNEYDSARRNDELQTHDLSLLMFQHHPGPLTNPSLVASWMTFDYISHLYALPPTYLQSALSISDRRYPKLSVITFAHDEATSTNAALSQVRAAVGSYLASQQP